MKANHHYFKQLFVVLLCLPSLILAQDTPTFFVQVTTMHWNLDDENFSFNDWRDAEVEFHEKVIMQNEHIVSRTVLRHHFTDDSSEILFITVYPSWVAIEQAAARNEELFKAAWVDKTERETYTKKRNRFYVPMHSDEIYKTIPGAKRLEELDLPLFYYVRTSHFKFPEDEIENEFMTLLNTYNTIVTDNNDHYKAYYPQVHFYGADRTEFVEVFVTETLAELEKGIEKQGSLYRAHWDTDEKKAAYNKVMNKYLSGTHRDRIYSSVPELHKPIDPIEED